MSSHLKSLFSSTRLCNSHLRFHIIKPVIFTIAISLIPHVVRSESIICETSQVFYTSKPALLTDCRHLYSVENSLATGLNARSLRYDESIHAIPKLGYIFGLLPQDDISDAYRFYPGFIDQKIAEEGSILESIYDQMLESQFLIYPIRTPSVESPFNSL